VEGGARGGGRARACAGVRVGGGPAGVGPALPPAPRVQVGGVVIARRHAAPVQDVRRRDEVHKRARPSLMSPVAGRGMWDWRVRGGGGEWGKCARARAGERAAAGARARGREGGGSGRARVPREREREAAGASEPTRTPRPNTPAPPPPRGRRHASVLTPGPTPRGMS
jgi:hypothetical protein